MKFKDKDQQFLYSGYVAITEDELKKVLVYQSATDIAFTRGYTGQPLVGFHNYDRTSQAYAAYCAGRDRKKHDLGKRLEGLETSDLKALRAIINGKLSKRQITLEQQSKMQAARKRKETP